LPAESKKTMPGGPNSLKRVSSAAPGAGEKEAGVRGDAERSFAQAEMFEVHHNSLAGDFLRSQSVARRAPGVVDTASVMGSSAISGKYGVSIILENGKGRAGRDRRGKTSRRRLPDSAKFDARSFHGCHATNTKP
jgi:hypothetical protein